MEMERTENLPSYPPEQHYGRCRHKGEHSGSDVARLNKVRVPCRATRAGSKNRWLDQPWWRTRRYCHKVMPNSCNCSTSLDYAHGIFAVCCSLEKLLLGEEMMRLEVDMRLLISRSSRKTKQYSLQQRWPTGLRHWRLHRMRSPQKISVLLEVARETIDPSSRKKRNGYLMRITRQSGERSKRQR